ncbi:MAG: PilZ domain-containing protein [Allosphingosinicella sp.]
MLTDNLIVETAFSISDRVPEPTDRRGPERIVTILRVGSLIIDGRRELCLIRNISAGGLLAHVYSALAPEQRITVELKTNQQLEGRIVWIRGENAGIAFDERVDITSLLSNPPVLENGWRARMPRVEVDRMATLRTGASTDWVHIRDISQGGVKIDCEQELEEGTEVVLTPDGFGPIAGSVRWRKGKYCGIAFNTLVPFDQLIGWLRTS